MAFEILFDKYDAWSFQFSFSSITIPKSLVFVTGAAQLCPIFILDFLLHILGEPDIEVYPYLMSMYLL